VPNIDKAIAQLDAKGCVFHDKQRGGAEGWKAAYSRDPEGNSIAVYSQEERGRE
jgi:predicted enzyme related to lactoylglutathione lyase